MFQLLLLLESTRELWADFCVGGLIELLNTEEETNAFKALFTSWLHSSPAHQHVPLLCAQKGQEPAAAGPRAGGKEAHLQPGLCLFVLLL